MEKVSIHRALSEIKLLDKRIEKSINSIDITGMRKKSGKFVEGTTLSEEEFNVKAEADYASVNDLIKRRTLIKKLIVLSNAETKVNIGGIEYTVAEAIESKKTIEIKKKLLDKIQTNYKCYQAIISDKNEKAADNLDKQISVMLGSDKQNKISGLEDFIEKYKKHNEWEIIDGINIEDKIKKLSKEIEDFENNVDFILSESNALTQINIPN